MGWRWSRSRITSSTIWDLTCEDRLGFRSHANCTNFLFSWGPMKKMGGVVVSRALSFKRTTPHHLFKNTFTSSMPPYYGWSSNEVIICQPFLIIPKMSFGSLESWSKKSFNQWLIIGEEDDSYFSFGFVCVSDIACLHVMPFSITS